MKILAIRAILTIVATVSGVVDASSIPIPDPAYGGAGDGVARVTFEVSPFFAYEPFAGVALPDGRLLLAGRVAGQFSQDAAFALLTTDGTLDTSFGPNQDGRLVAGLEPADVAGVALAPGNKLLFVGTASNAAMIGRMTYTGAPDATFDTDGQRFVGANAFVDGGSVAEFVRTAPQEGGKFLAIGFAASTTIECAVAMRFNDNGSTDTTFGAGQGHVCIAPAITSTPASAAFDVAVLEDGRILLAGGSVYPGSSSIDMSVARLLADGTLDTTFGPAQDGWAFVPFDEGGSLADNANAIAVDASGRIVLVGDVSTADLGRIGVARLQPDGQPDMTFGTNGRTEIDFNSSNYLGASGHSVRILPDGHILVGGKAIGNGADYSSILVMLQENGQLEPHFGQGGRYLDADLSTPESRHIYGYGQAIAGDYIYMFGDALDPVDNSIREFGAVRVVLPVFSDGFDGVPAGR